MILLSLGHYEIEPTRITHFYGAAHNRLAPNVAVLEVTLFHEAGVPPLEIDEVVVITLQHPHIGVGSCYADHAAMR